MHLSSCLLALYVRICLYGSISSCLLSCVSAFVCLCVYICQPAWLHLFLPFNLSHFLLIYFYILYPSVCLFCFFIYWHSGLFFYLLLDHKSCVCVTRAAGVAAQCDRMLNHHFRRNPDLQEELQIQAAVAAGDVYTVRKMLEQGYSPKIRDANGWTLLHFSAAKGKERCVRVFLEHGGRQTGFPFVSTKTRFL